MASERVILGIDPGTIILGYSVIRLLDRKTELMVMDVLKLPTGANHADKLKKIFECTMELIDGHHPDELAIEDPFFGKDAQAMLKLGRAQGVVMAAALHRSIPIFEYSPRRIKKSITGNGNSTKEMVAHMLQQMLNFKEKPRHLDATDALAVAVCHSFQTGPQSTGKQYKGWGEFLKNNPGRGNL